LPKYIFYKRCAVKTGFLYLIQKRPNSENDDLIEVMPIFASLTPKTFILKESPMIKTTLSTIKLKDLMRIDQQYQKSFCFDLITTRVSKKSKALKKGILSLCTDNKKHFHIWVKKILEFKQCKISNIRHDPNKKLLMDFKNINKAKSRKRHSGFGHLFYNKHDVAVNKDFSRKRTHFIRQLLDKLRINIRRGNLAEEQVKRQMRGKLNNQQTFRDQIYNKESNLRAKLEKKLNFERNKEANLMKWMNKKKEKKLIEKVMDKIRHYKEEEVGNLKNIFKKQIKHQNKLAKLEAKNMMNIIINENKLTKYKVCYDERLIKFKNREFVNNLCMKYYGASGHGVCKTRASFCIMCCEFHIGIKFPLKRVKCRKKCNKNIKGKLSHKEREAEFKTRKKIRKGNIRKTIQNQIQRIQKLRKKIQNQIQRIQKLRE